MRGVSVLPDEEFLEAIRPLSKRRQVIVLEEREALVRIAMRAEADRDYWRRQAADAKVVAQDRDRYARELEKGEMVRMGRSG